MIDLQISKPAGTDHLRTIGKRASSTFSTLQNSYSLALACLDNKVPGVFVECGTGRGAQVAAMALACIHLNTTRDIHLFDSFLGIPLAGPKDTVQPGVGEITTDQSLPLRKRLVPGAGEISVEQVKEHMVQWEVDSVPMYYHEGWFQDTIEAWAKANTVESAKPIALLRLDGDLYESTLICLQYLHPLLHDDGFLIIDDYGLAGCAHACNEYFGVNCIDMPAFHQVEKPSWRVLFAKKKEIEAARNGA